MNEIDTENKNFDVSVKFIGDKKYIVKSVYVGDKDIKSTILKLAEHRAIKEMGLDNSIA